MIPDHHIIKICEAYSLGNPLLEIKKVPGGLLHQLFFLQTSSGDYALKILDKTSQALLSHNLLTAEMSQQVAQKMQFHQVPTVVALAYQEKYVFCLEDKAYLVMPWISGCSKLPRELPTSSVQIIGNILGHIQAVNLKGSFPVPNWRGANKKEWLDLLGIVRHLNTNLSGLLTKELEYLIDWSQQANQVWDKLNRELVFSHRDFDPKNVIWKTLTQPILIDWEYAGLINPQLDIFIVALNWSDVISGCISADKFKAIVKGYFKSTVNTKPLTSEVIHGYKGYCLDWLLYNLESLSRRPSSFHEVINTLNALHVVTNNHDKLMYWYNEAAFHSSEET